MTHDHRTRFRLGLAVAAVAVLVALLAGCSGGGAREPAAVAHGPADVTFVQGMIPHHRQAVAMSGLAATRAAAPEVIDLAARISAAQGPEIDRMNGLLASWGLPPSDAAAGTEHAGMGEMMGPEQMRGLEAARGPAFDRAFLQMMIEHHAGAIAMARTELAQGRSAAAKDLARTVADAQQAEIGEMQALLGRG